MNIILENYSYLLKLNQPGKAALPLQGNLEKTSVEKFEDLRNSIQLLRKILKENNFEAGDYAQNHLTTFLNKKKLHDLLQAIEEFDYEKALLLLNNLETELIRLWGENNE